MKRLITLIFGILVIGAIAYLVYEYRADFGLAGLPLEMLIAVSPAASARREEDVKHFFHSLSLTSAAHPSQQSV